MRFDPEYVSHVLNENFEDAKTLFLAPLMAIHYAHLVMLADRGIIGAADARALREALDSISDLFLLPSLQESFGLAALEAMACGVPVIASRVGGLAEVIDHGRTGFLHDLDDIDGMASSGVALLTDPARHADVAAQGRRSVKVRFCADLFVPRYEAFFRELTGEVRA